jgi:hypothetical protein
MAWKTDDPKELLPDLPLTRASVETNWESGYPNSLERWIKDLSPTYTLDAEYDLGDNKTLYRFKSLAGHFQNVVIGNK